MGKMVETENLICLKDQSTVKKRRIQFYTHFFQRWNKLGEHLLRIFLSFCLQRAFNFLSYHVASRFSIHFEILLLNPQSDTSKIASRQKAKKCIVKSFCACVCREETTVVTTTTTTTSTSRRRLPSAPEARLRRLFTSTHAQRPISAPVMCSDSVIVPGDVGPVTTMSNLKSPCYCHCTNQDQQDQVNCPETFSNFWGPKRMPRAYLQKKITKNNPSVVIEEMVKIRVQL